LSATKDSAFARRIFGTSQNPTAAYTATSAAAAAAMRISFRALRSSSGSGDARLS
jgi:hypothetical protein